MKIFHGSVKILTHEKNIISKKYCSYLRKVFAIDFFISPFDKKRKHKQKVDSITLMCLLLCLAGGFASMQAISDEFSNRNNGQTLSRSVLESFLKIEALPSLLRKQIKSMVKKMKRGKMISLDHVQGKTIASVDGIEIYRKSYTPEEFFEAVLEGHVCSLCQVSVHRDKKTGKIIGYETYHRLVVITVITDRGPMPLAWKFQNSNAHEKYENWLKNDAKPENHPAENDSVEKAKQEGELSVMSMIFVEIAESFNKSLPFDVLIGDGLYDKANIIDLVEKYGVSLVAVHKNEQRVLRQDAAEDFTIRKPDREWELNGCKYQGWSGVYLDENRENKNNNRVKIIRVIREPKDSSKIDNYFYCSNRNFIRPNFVEWCRFYRWKEENGFNAWTNQWGLLKHMFCHHSLACDSIVGLIFITIIAIENFRKSYLKRGKYGFVYKLTLKQFFDLFKESYAFVVDFREMLSLIMGPLPDT